MIPSSSSPYLPFFLSNRSNQPENLHQPTNILHPSSLSSPSPSKRLGTLHSSSHNGLGSSSLLGGSNNLASPAHHRSAQLTSTSSHSRPSSSNHPHRPQSESTVNQIGGSSRYNKHSHNSHDLATEEAMQEYLQLLGSYESTLEEMANASIDQNFKEELAAIEQWFKVLSEAERTAALYSLLQQTTQVQIRFFATVLNQMTQKHPISALMSPSSSSAMNDNKNGMVERVNDLMGNLHLERTGSSNANHTSTSTNNTTHSPASNSNSNHNHSNNNNNNNNSSFLRHGSSIIGQHNVNTRGNPNALDPSTINAMFPDAAAALAQQRAIIQANANNIMNSNNNNANNTSRDNYLSRDAASSYTDRPKSSDGNGWQAQNQGQIGIGGLPHSHSMQSTRHHGNTPADQNKSSQAFQDLSPYVTGNWASLTNTPMHPMFTRANNGYGSTTPDIDPNKNIGKLNSGGAILDSETKQFRRRSPQSPIPQMSGKMRSKESLQPHNYIPVYDENGSFVGDMPPSSPFQRLNSSPHIASNMPPGFTGGSHGWPLSSPQNNSFISAFDPSSPAMGSLTEGYISDASYGGRRSQNRRRANSRPPEDPTDPQLLEDIPAWLRSLRLHKYTENLRTLHWTELIEMDDEALQRKGIAALGARRKLLKVFEQVKEAQSQEN